jgi:hypothetical protein
MPQLRPGDVLLTTHFGLPALWWYGGIDVNPPLAGSVHERTGTRLFEVRHVGRAPGTCETSEQRSELQVAMKGASRVAVYMGFGSTPPGGFPEMVFDELSRMGAITAYRRMADEGVAAIFDLRQPPAPWNVVESGAMGQIVRDVPRPGGCLGVKPAERW